MTSKSIVLRILALTLFFMGTPAWATISGTSTTQQGCPTTSTCKTLTVSQRCSKVPICGTSVLCTSTCGLSKSNCSYCPRSIGIEGILKKLGNVTNDPTAFAVHILIEEGQIAFKNPAGNSLEGQGVPFGGVTVQLNSALPILANQVSKNGTAKSTIVFHDPEMIQAVKAQLQAQCDGGDASACDTLDALKKADTNWLAFIVVTRLQVLGQQYTDPDTTTNTCNLTPDASGTINPSNCTLTDALGTQCNAPANVVADPEAYAGVAFDYACTESCHDATGTSCSPYTLPLP